MANEVRLIDANALIASRDLHINIGAGDNICIDIADIAKAPTIDPESLRPKGRWVKDRDGDEYCENCSRYMPVREVTGDPSAHNYCPNCGVKMEGRENG